MLCVKKFQLAFYSFSKTSYISNRFSHLSAYAIVFKEYGDPNKVLEKIQCDVPVDLDSNQVLVKIQASSINPADINIIQGKYAIKPKLPAIAGGEAIGEVLKVGAGVKNLEVGDRVMPATPASGTWKTHGVYEDNNLIQIDKTIPLQSAVTLSTNPCTAYRMLKDFVNLKEGDTVIQNGANSAVGQAAIQIAKYLKINTINVVRDRPTLPALKSYLSGLGATYVVAENELRNPIMKDIFNHIPKPRLGFNCVGGKSTAELIRHMSDKGTLVTYGGMSKQPLLINTGCLIFNDIRIVGYWMSRWVLEHSKEERSKMLNELTDIVKSGDLKPPTLREVDFDNFKEALTKSMEEYATEKQILVMK